MTIKEFKKMIKNIPDEYIMFHQPSVSPITESDWQIDKENKFLVFG